MEITEIISAALLLIAGIGVFIIACGMLSSNIETVGSRQLKSLFSKTANKKFLGVGIGAATTAAVQSSAATIVLVIGFVSAGIMTMPLAASIIYGANIGTTITAWIASMSTVDSTTISLVVVFSAMVGLGSFITMFAKTDNRKNIGGVLAGFGLIFVGLFLMSHSMGELAHSEGIKNLISSVDNIFLLILIGFAITALTQSSSVTTAILISMLPAGTMTGLITLEQAIYITLGANIGSCVIVMISGYTGGVNAKRAAMVHLCFNVFGVTLFVIAEFILKAFGSGFADIFSNVFVGMAAMQLATFHTSFKVITALIMLPLTTPLLAGISRMIPDNEDVPDTPHLFYIDNYMLRNPPIAVQQLKLEVMNMADIAMANFRTSMRMIKTMDFSGKEEFDRNERELDYLNKEIARYLIKLNKLKLDRKDRYYVSSVYKSVTDLERIGDHAQNILEYAEKMKDNNGNFSEIAKNEIGQLEELINELYEKIKEAYRLVDLKMVDEAFDIEQRVDDLTAQMAENHVNRLNDGTCTLEVGAEYLSMTSDAERVADHLINLGKAVRDFAYL